MVSVSPSIRRHPNPKKSFEQDGVGEEAVTTAPRLMRGAVARGLVKLMKRAPVSRSGLKRLWILRAAPGQVSHPQIAERQHTSKNKTTQPQGVWSEALINPAAEHGADEEGKSPGGTEDALVQAAQFDGGKVGDEGGRDRRGSDLTQRPDGDGEEIKRQQVAGEHVQAETCPEKKSRDGHGAEARPVRGRIAHLDAERHDQEAVDGDGHSKIGGGESVRLHVERQGDVALHVDDPDEQSQRAENQQKRFAPDLADALV